MKLPDQTNDDSAAESSSEVEAVVASAREHFATAFPNPRREGCPAAGVIQTVVESERVPNDALQAHLFNCSECFNEYRTAVQTWRMEKQRAAKLGRRSAWELFGNWRTLVSAAAAALVLLSAGLWFGRASSPQSNQVRSQPTPMAPVVAESKQPESIGTTSPTPSVAEPQSHISQESLLAVKIDLNDTRSLGAQRRGGGEAGSPILLRRARLRLLLTLRENSPAGSYRVSLFENGRKCDAAVARSFDGKTLQIMLDLRRVAGSQARLSIQRANQPDVAPDEYSVVIERP